MEEGLSAEGFYDDLAEEYHLIVPDWWKAAEGQGGVIGTLLLDAGVPPGSRVLDATCGIGTQALPLARAGYRVLGSDLSAKAVARAREEARARGIDLELLVCDVREVGEHVLPGFDAAIACDNSLAHLPTEDDLGAALRSIRTCLAPGGRFLATTRDYDRLARERAAGVMPTTYLAAGERRIVGQAWEWDETGGSVLIRLFILSEGPEGWSCSVRTTRCRAWRRSEMSRALMASGFRDVTWHEPEDTGYYQPIVTASAV